MSDDIRYWDPGQRDFTSTPPPPRLVGRTLHVGADVAAKLTRVAETISANTGAPGLLDATYTFDINFKGKRTQYIGTRVVIDDSLPAHCVRLPDGTVIDTKTGEEATLP